ncbi:MAG TPA: Zn-dependent hydrolase [Bacteroidetes bacterium]|nr:Zn-dependent hydrolase [Bacteroidota bacterium]
MKKILSFSLPVIILLSGCKISQKEELTTIQKKVNEFVEVELTSDLIAELSEKERQMLPYLFDAADIMDKLFWKQAYGDKSELLDTITDEATRAFVLINYGPWERLNNNRPFIEGAGEKPAGASFYPPDMTREEFEALDAPDKTSLYTLIRRDENGNLITVPYHKAYRPELEKAAELIRKAAGLAEDEGLKKYLELRSEALLTDDYYPSDLAWMDMKTNNIDFVVGPIENYEDGLFNYKAAYESFILVKDNEWSRKLEKFSALLPELQTTLPVPPEYKSEVPGSSSDLGVYDAIYYAGDCNAGSKTIAINLPNDERVQAEKGSRKLQLKNAMRYKFEKIMVPIADLLIEEDQRKHITFDAFFENTMFHEVGHGLGINNTITGKGTVREALKEQYSAIEEGKADILGLFLVTRLAEMGELGEKDLMDNYVTFMAGIFRSVRFGASSAHGKANMIRFNYFLEKEAFSRDETTGTYRVDFDKMTEAMNELASEILTIQGDGNYEAARQMVEEKGMIGDMLRADLQRIAAAGIPRDIRFRQGKEVAGLIE